MGERTMEFSAADGVGVITLNRPRARNAIDPQFTEDLREAVERCAADQAVRAVLIRAEGPTFTVGGDVAAMAEIPVAELPALLSRITAVYHATLQLLDQLPVPVVTAVHGAVAGGGLGLVYIADIVLAAESTRFAAGFAGLGLSVDSGGTWFLPRLVGARRAAELCLSPRVLTAPEAAEWGLITRHVRDEDLWGEAETAARLLAAGPTRALGEIRALLRRSYGAKLGDQLRDESEALARTGATRDAAHGIASFMAKTKPDFEGR
ncbi:MAG: enoyl-CoA hydratase-related protein [Streptosporangiaceae bacterium]